MDMEKLKKAYEEYMKNKPKASGKEIPSDVIIKTQK